MKRYVITIRQWLAARLDTIGIGLSGLCAVHCAALPLLLGSGLLLNGRNHGQPGDPTHAILFALAGPISVIALWRGFRQHGVWWPLVTGAIGVGLLGRGLLQSHDDEMARALTLIGAVVLALTHFYNWRRHVATHSAPAPECERREQPHVTRRSNHALTLTRDLVQHDRSRAGDIERTR